MPFIYSTLTCGNNFAIYKPSTDPKALPRTIKRIEIKGGHGMKNPQGIQTPQGVVTQVTDEDLALLEENISFRQQVEAGFIVVDNKKVNPAKRAVDMAEKDGSAPMTEKDFEKSDELGDDISTYKKKKTR